MKKIGLLTSIAIGDASGAPFEFADKGMLKQFNPLFYPGGTGIYTDDTQMSIAVALHTLGDFDYTVTDYSSHFWGQYQLDRTRPGFSRRTRAALEEDSVEWFMRSCASQMPRDTNGCVMRVLPVGYLRDVERVKQAALVQCVVTHPYAECILASQFVALMAHYFIYRNGETNIDQFLMDQLGVEEFKKVSYAWSSGNEVPCNALKTASFCYNRNSIKEPSTSKILEQAVLVGGDVDSTAAICLGLASLNKNAIDDLSATLYETLENGEFGRDYLDGLDLRLAQKFGI